MKKNVTKSDFLDAFHNCGRGDSFTYAGLGALYDYLEELEGDCDIEVELDPISIDCDYCEYTSLQACCNDFGLLDDIVDKDSLPEWSDYQYRRLLQNSADIIAEFAGGVIIRSF